MKRKKKKNKFSTIIYQTEIDQNLNLLQPEFSQKFLEDINMYLYSGNNTYPILKEILSFDLLSVMIMDFNMERDSYHSTPYQ